MNLAEKRRRISSQFCPGCGELLLTDQDCPACGAMIDPVGEDPLEFSVSLSILHCDACDRVMSLGTLACPSCGEPTDPSEPTDPREGPVNRVKLQALGDLLPIFREAASVPAREREPVAALTDDQLLAYVTRHNIFSPDRLIGNLKALVRRVDLSTEAAARSPDTRRAFEGVLDATQELRAIYDELDAVRAPEQFRRLHLLVLASYRAALDLHLACAQGVLAVTVEEARDAQRMVRVATDRLSVLGEQVAAEVEAADVEVAAFDQVERRLGAFAGEAGQYEHAGRPDLAAVLVAGLRRHGDFAGLGRIGAAYFGRMLPADPTTLPPEQGLGLYVLAAEVAASDDPLTVKRRANVLLDLLNAAFERDPRAMAAALAADEAETEEALVYLLVLGETLRGLQVNDLSREAVRYNLATAYEKLVEGVYGRLVNVPLAAKSILGRRPKSYREIAELALGAKQNEIDQATDPRFAAAFIGVSTVARNAGAHCTVDTAGDKIRLTERDKKGRVEVEELTDDEFTTRLHDLLLTCHALRLSAELFRIEHHHELPPPGPTSRPRVIAEAARVVVGYFGLVRASVHFDGQERVVIDAEEDERTPGRAPRGYLPAVFTMAVLFPNYATAELRVARDGSRKCRVEVPIAEVLAHKAFPDDVELYSLLKLCYVSTVEPREVEDPERYVQELVKPGARLLVQDLAALQQSRAELPKTKQEYAAKLGVLIRKVNLFADVLQELAPPKAAVPPRDSLLAGLTALERGLGEHQRLMRSGQWAAVGRRSERLERGARIAVHWTD